MLLQLLDNTAKSGKITAEICKNHEIHSEITSSSVKSEHESKAVIINM